MAEPGWYPDPEDSGHWRYWDGVSWTAHRAPFQRPPESSGPAAALPYDLPAQSIESPAPRRRSRVLVWGAIATIIALAGTATWVWVSRSDNDVQMIAADDPGPDPFASGDFAEPVPVELVELADELAEEADAEASLEEIATPIESGSEVEDIIEASQARIDAVITTADQAGLSVIAPSSAVGVGLYGGSGINACDINGLKGFFATHNAQSEAFASVLGIERDNIDSFLDGLTAGFLLADTRVVNHGFKNGEAYDIPAVLERGTAVLVDDQGAPRVRCKCGNPLAPVGIELDGEIVSERIFADEVIESRIDPELADENRVTNEALGIPDGQNVSLGYAERECEFFVSVRFTDNVLVNGPGDDLRVVETGAIEDTDVYVQSDGEWLEIGRIDGGDSSIDLSPAVERGFETTEVKLCDAPGTGSSSVPGADIDAVAALNWRPA